MPTYEYACTSCGHHLEAVQSFSDEPLKTCPNCGGDLRKVFGSIGIVLKGSGFYRTDSRTSSNGKSAAKETKEKDKEKKDTASSGSGGAAAASGSGTSSSAASSSSSSGSSPSTGTSGSGSAGSSTAAAS